MITKAKLKSLNFIRRACTLLERGNQGTETGGHLLQPQPHMQFMNLYIIMSLQIILAKMRQHFLCCFLGQLLSSAC